MDDVTTPYLDNMAIACLIGCVIGLIIAVLFLEGQLNKSEAENAKMRKALQEFRSEDMDEEHLDPAPKEEVKIVGHLNRDYGYKNFTPIPKGSPVYMSSLTPNEVFMYHTLIATGERQRISFYKEQFKPHYDKIK